MNKSSSNTGRMRDKYLADNGKIYLDKRIVVRQAQSAGRAAVARATEEMGYSIVAERGWVIKKYADGTREKLHPIG
jgi:hypothetical protein